jgi:hypothetical protein
MENYILNLLKENSRVIIPEFGAFIIRQQNPPEIAFNALLSFNDGILSEYVSHKAGITFAEASAKVSDYVEKLNIDLKLHNRLTFNEIGWVWLDESGEKQFTPWKGGERIESETVTPLRNLETILKEAEQAGKSQNEIIPDSQVFQTADQAPFILDDTIKEVDVDATKDVLPEKSAEGFAEEDKTSAEFFSLEETVMSEPETGSKAETPVDSGNEILIKPKINLSETLQEFQKEKSETETGNEVTKIEIRFKHEMPPEETVIAQDYVTPEVSDIQKSPAETDISGSVQDDPKKSIDKVWQEIESKPADVRKKVKEKKKNSFAVPVFIIGTIIVLAAAAWFIFPDQVKKIIPREKQNQVEISPGVEIPGDPGASTSDPGKSDEQITDQPVISVVPADNQVPVKKYYVVAGRFRSLQNAEKYTSELRSKGFNSEYFPTNDNLYTVSFNSFSTRESAEAEMNRIRKTTEPNAWIFYY